MRKLLVPLLTLPLLAMLACGDDSGSGDDDGNNAANNAATNNANNNVPGQCPNEGPHHFRATLAGAVEGRVEIEGSTLCIGAPNPTSVTLGIAAKAPGTDDDLAFLIGFENLGPGQTGDAFVSRMTINRGGATPGAWTSKGAECTFSITTNTLLEETMFGDWYDLEGTGTCPVTLEEALDVTDIAISATVIF